MAGYRHVYFRGRWVTPDEAVVPVGSLALRYGLSVFEGIRLYCPEDGGPAHPFLLREHLDRMVRSLEAMRFPDPGTAGMPEIIDDLIKRNGITEDSYVRVAATPFNAGQLGEPAKPEFTVTAAAMGRKPWLAQDRAMRLCVSAWERGSPRVHPPHAKNIANYAGPRLAWLEARERGFDGCILVNRAGRLAEAPTAALFLVHDGVLRTPALSEDVLPSITRAWVLRAAAARGIATEQTQLSAKDAWSADEAFLCGTGLEIAPVASIDDHDFKFAAQRPLTRQLIADYFAQARQRPSVWEAADGGCD